MLFAAEQKAQNATSYSPLGMVCDASAGQGSCITTPSFDEAAHEMLKVLSNYIRPVSGETHPLQLQSSSVCSAVYPYVPSYCTCINSAGGGTVDCPVKVVVGGTVVDTIKFDVVMQVCGNPAVLGEFWFYFFSFQGCTRDTVNSFCNVRCYNG